MAVMATVAAGLVLAVYVSRTTAIKKMGAFLISLLRLL